MMRTAATAAVATALIALAGAPAGTAAATSAPAHAPSVDTAGGKDEDAQMTRPLVFAHRGASGHRPEHTLAAYELAVAMGADYIEPDLVATKDGELVDRHEPEISGTTDVAEHPEFASRRTTKMLDGVATTGWFTEDFTLAELRTLRATERLPEIRPHNTLWDGRWTVPTFEEVLRLRAELSKKHGREIGIIPEIKHSTYFAEAGVPQERKVVALAEKYGLNTRHAPMWIQSFELTNLIELRTKHGYKASSTFLTTAQDGPYDLRARGDERSYADLLTDAGLRDLRRHIDGISPEKDQVVPRRPGGDLGTPTDLVDRAHRADLQVVPWTFRAENEFLPADYRRGSDPAHYGRAVDELVVFMRTGVDGVFTDQPDVGVTARKQFLAES